MQKTNYCKQQTTNYEKKAKTSQTIADEESLGDPTRFLTGRNHQQNPSSYFVAVYLKQKTKNSQKTMYCWFRLAHQIPAKQMYRSWWWMSEVIDGVDGFAFLPSKSFSVDVFRPEKLEISHSTVSVGSTSGFCEANVSYSPFQRLKRHLTNYKNFKIRIASDNHSNIFFCSHWLSEV